MAKPTTNLEIADITAGRCTWKEHGKTLPTLSECF